MLFEGVGSPEDDGGKRGTGGGKLEPDGGKLESDGGKLESDGGKRGTGGGKLEPDGGKAACSPLLEPIAVMFQVERVTGRFADLEISWCLFRFEDIREAGIVETKETAVVDTCSFGLA